ncbi:LysR family transcriptional regulator [Agrobacterium rhizogenes]|nr:LysR family transcriptional regulator [Rhizobium rhizogenes]NTJ77322.1 LysR family transcriptional regulator [Rhizobium rhizogenes]
MKLSRRFPLNALRVFEAAARLGSFTRAGEELGMTQTAVSYQIKLLEEITGEPLFLRRPRQILLTETGEQLAPKVAEAFAMLQEAMASISGETETTLHIHSTPTFASQWLARHLGSFQLKHPNIAVRLDTSASVIDFAREPSDIAIRAGRGKWPGLRTHLLMKVYFTPMLSPALAETVGGIHEPSDLLKLRIIDAGDPWWAQWFKEAGVPDPGLQGRPRSRLGAQSFEASAAIAGQGVAVLTPEFYADDLASGRLIQPFNILSTDESDYWIAYPENRRHTPRIRAFRDWILGEFGMPLE